MLAYRSVLFIYFLERLDSALSFNTLAHFSHWLLKGFVSKNIVHICTSPQVDSHVLVSGMNLS